MNLKQIVAHLVENWHACLFPLDQNGEPRGVDWKASKFTTSELAAYVDGGVGIGWRLEGFLAIGFENCPVAIQQFLSLWEQSGDERFRDAVGLKSLEQIFVFLQDTRNAAHNKQLSAWPKLQLLGRDDWIKVEGVLFKPAELMQ